MAASGNGRGNGQAVLVVDDDRHLCDLLTDLLEDAGYTVFTASDGASALARLLYHPTPLVVVLDWLMPHMDGVAVLRAVARSGGAAASRRHVYVLLTGSEDRARPLLADLQEDLSVTLVGKLLDVDDLLARVAGAASQLLN